MNRKKLWAPMKVKGASPFEIRILRLLHRDKPVFSMALGRVGRVTAETLGWFGIWRGRRLAGVTRFRADDESLVLKWDKTQWIITHPARVWSRLRRSSRNAQKRQAK